MALEASGKLQKLIKSTVDLYAGLGDPQATNVGVWDGNPEITPPTDARLNRPATSMVPADEGNALIDELGVLRDLFDLGWLEDFTTDTINPSSFGPP